MTCGLILRRCLSAQNSPIWTSPDARELLSSRRRMAGWRADRRRRGGGISHL